MRLEEKLAALRREHKMTQAELAEALDVSRQAVSKWERGIASSMENLVCMGRLFGVPVEQLVDESLALQKSPWRWRRWRSRRHSRAARAQGCDGHRTGGVPAAVGHRVGHHHWFRNCEGFQAATQRDHLAG